MTQCTPDPILRFTDGTNIVDLLGPGSGWKIADPYWNPQIAQYKGGGSKINPSIAPGQRLVHKEYDNVIETIPLIASGIDQERCIATINALLSLARQSADYWAESYEFDDVWMEAKPAGVNSYTGYAQVIQMRLPELVNPYGQPFFSPYNEAVMEGLSLIVEREPLWRAVAPGQLIGPLYNLIRNPDFELWNNGIVDSQPDSWTDLETIQITGDNSRQDTAINSGQYALKVHVGGSTNTGRIKGVSQTISTIRANTTYTVVAWVRNDGVSNGVGRILVTYSSQLEVYRDSIKHGWTLYTGKFTTGDNDTVAINLEILTTAAGTDGSVYFDTLMLLEGDWEQEAIDGVLPYITSSHIVNHWDQPTGVIEAGDINYVDVFNVPGNVDALVRLEVVNNTTPSQLGNPSELIAALRVGMRRSGNVFNFLGFQDPLGALDTASSSNNRINSGTLSTTAWTTVISQTIETPSLTLDNQGKYRLFVRAFDTRTGGVLTLQMRCRFWIGSGLTGIKTLEAVTVPILNNWCVIDLTPMSAINWDTKFNPNVPSQFGFEVQMKRTANTDAGRIDYMLLMPTDGGIAVAEIDPAVIQNDGVVIDCTVAAPRVYGGHVVINQWNIVSETSTSGNTMNDLQNYRGALYLTQGADIYQYRNNIMTRFSISGVAVSSPLVVFGCCLFYFFTTTPSTAYASDGSFPGTATFTFGPGGGTDTFAALSYNGNLYLAGEDLATSDATLYAWPGSGATATNLLFRADIDSFVGIGAYRGNLYLAGAIGGTVRVFEYNITTGVLTEQFDTGSASVTIDFVEFNNLLYFTNNTATIRYYDGSTWTSLTPFPALAPLWRGINSLDGTLFVTGRDVSATPDTIVVIRSTDGITFTLDYHPPGTLSVSGSRMEISQGQLFLGTQSQAGIAPKLHAKSLSVNEFQSSNYQLIPFASPPQTRHKYIFNWDRKANVNNIDDQALVGIGFVPRYLALRGKG